MPSKSTRTCSQTPRGPDSNFARGRPAAFCRSKAVGNRCNALFYLVLRKQGQKPTGGKAVGFVYNPFHQKDYGMREINPLLRRDLRPKARKGRKKMSATSRFLG